jgi:DNA-binding transcriptional ArsR family regulator
VSESSQSLDRLFGALSDAHRRHLLERLQDHPEQTVGELQVGFGGTRQALSKHLAVLESAGLLVTHWRGREKLHSLDLSALDLLPRRWMTPVAAPSLPSASVQEKALLAGTHASDRGALTHPGDATWLEALAAPSGLNGRPVQTLAQLQTAQAYLAQSAAVFQRLLEQLCAEQGYAMPSDGSFSLAASVWHLADLEEEAWGPRLERMLTETRPNLVGFNGGRVAKERDYQHRPWRGAARRFIAQRRRSLRLLGRFDEAVLSRRVRFSGAASAAAQVLAAMVAHDEEHRQLMAAQLRDLLAADLHRTVAA